MHQHDYVECECKQIAVDGGASYWRAFSVDWKNFIRINDDGSEFVPEVVEKETPSNLPVDTKLVVVEVTKEERRKNFERSLKTLIEETERDIDHGNAPYVTRYEIVRLLELYWDLLALIE
jgi:hypothetical protein